MPIDGVAISALDVRSAKVHIFCDTTKYFIKIMQFFLMVYMYIESTSKCKMSAKLGIMFEKHLIWCEEI